MSAAPATPWCRHSARLQAVWSRAALARRATDASHGGAIGHQAVSSGGRAGQLR